MGEDDDKSGRGAWNSVEAGEDWILLFLYFHILKESETYKFVFILEESVIETAALEAPILDLEPSLGQGVGGALTLAISKGYLQKEDSNRPSASRFAHLQAQNYSIEDKTYG